MKTTQIRQLKFLHKFLSLRRSVMFIGMRLKMTPSSVRSDVPAPDVAPDGAEAIKTATIYKHGAPPERGNEA